MSRDGEIEVTITARDIREWRATSVNRFEIDGGPGESDLRRMVEIRGLDVDRWPVLRWTDLDGTIRFVGMKRGSRGTMG